VEVQSDLNLTICLGGMKNVAKSRFIIKLRLIYKATGNLVTQDVLLN